MDRPLTQREIDSLPTRGRKRKFKLAASVPRTAVAFADRYLPFSQSPAWRAVRAAMYGESVDGEAFASVCGFDTPRDGGYNIAVIVAGRRGGKSANEACDGVYECVVRGSEHMRFLAPGQRGYVPILCRSMRQATETFRYARAIVENNAELATLVDGEILESATGGEIRFLNGTVLTVMPASKASVRGYSILAAILDEWAWLATDDESANQDREILSAVRYGMIAPKGAPPRRLAIISSPATKSGIVYEYYSEHFGKPDAPILVAHGPTWIWNPSIDSAELEEERKRDPRTFSREVLAEFTDAISAWCEAATVERACIGRDAKPLPANSHVSYWAAVDFAFKRDRSVLAVGHLEIADKDQPQRFIVDGVWRWTPKADAPLDARHVANQIASILVPYGVNRLVGDQHASIPMADILRSCGVRFQELTATSQSKVEIFTCLREAFYADRVSLPKDETMLTEFRELEERITPGGTIQISHPKRATAHDDHPHAVAWLLAATKLYAPYRHDPNVYYSPMSDADDIAQLTADNCFNFNFSREERTSR